MAKNEIKNKGFTVIEAITAVFVLTIGVVGCTLLANQALSSSEISRSRLIAVNLAQEGIEIVRNIRDANWLAGQNWNTGLSANSHEVKYDSTNSPIPCDITAAGTYCAWSEPGNYLKIDSNSNYNYDASGTTTTFKRKVTISYPQTYEMKIECTVYWETKGVSKEILLTEHLYDWK